MYDPAYTGVAPYYGSSGYPVYVGPPVELNLGFGYYGGHGHYSGRHYGHYRGHHGGHYRGHHGGHYRGHGGRHGGPHHGGGHGHGRGRH